MEKLSHLRVGYLNHFNATQMIQWEVGGDKKV
jgi:hypothetical protein